MNTLGTVSLPLLPILLIVLAMPVIFLAGKKWGVITNRLDSFEKKEEDRAKELGVHIKAAWEVADEKMKAAIQEVKDRAALDMAATTLQTIAQPSVQALTAAPASPGTIPAPAPAAAAPAAQ